jgi:hypothetical protein
VLPTPDLLVDHLIEAERRAGDPLACNIVGLIHGA